MKISNYNYEVIMRCAAMDEPTEMSKAKQQQNALKANC